MGRANVGLLDGGMGRRQGRLRVWTPDTDWRLCNTLFVYKLATVLLLISEGCCKDEMN